LNGDPLNGEPLDLGHLRTLAGAADRGTALRGHEASLRRKWHKDRSPAPRLAPIGDEAGIVMVAQSNRLHLSPCRQFAALPIGCPILVRGFNVLHVPDVRF